MSLEEKLPKGKRNVLSIVYGGFINLVNRIVEYYREKEAEEEAREEMEERLKTDNYPDIGEGAGAHWQREIEFLNRGKR